MVHSYASDTEEACRGPWAISVGWGSAGIAHCCGGCRAAAAPAVQGQDARPHRHIHHSTGIHCCLHWPTQHCWPPGLQRAISEEAGQKSAPTTAPSQPGAHKHCAVQGGHTGVMQVPGMGALEVGRSAHIPVRATSAGGDQAQQPSRAELRHKEAASPAEANALWLAQSSALPQAIHRG
jgi:hypothetical protein